jgi:hypothetical protein
MRRRPGWCCDDSNFLRAGSSAPQRTGMGLTVVALYFELTPTSNRTARVEGQINEARSFRHFFLRGLKKVQGEWAIVCLTHNILKLHRLCHG